MTHKDEKERSKQEKMNTEDVERRLKRGAADVGIDLIDLRTTTEEEEFLRRCGLPSDLPTKGGGAFPVRRVAADMLMSVSVVMMLLCWPWKNTKDTHDTCQKIKKKKIYKYSL